MLGVTCSIVFLNQPRLFLRGFSTRPTCLLVLSVHGDGLRSSSCLSRSIAACSALEISCLSSLGFVSVTAARYGSCQIGYFRTTSRTVSLLGQPNRPNGKHAFRRFRRKNILTFFCSSPAKSAVKRCALVYAPKIRVDTYSFTAYRTSKSSPGLLVRTEALCTSGCFWQMTQLLCGTRHDLATNREQVVSLKRATVSKSKS